MRYLYFITTLNQLSNTELAIYLLVFVFFTVLLQIRKTRHPLRWADRIYNIYKYYLWHIVLL